MKRIVVSLLIFLLAMVIVTIILSYRTFRKSLPQTEGEVEIQAINKPVEIYRDENGVPHIFAQNDHDLYFTMGYTIAQDRLWQLEIVRRVVNGRLAEVLGDTAVATDEFLLTIGFKRIAGELYSRASENSRMILQAYTNGINHYIDTHKGEYPIEFTFLNFKPQYWHPEDCLGLSRFVAWQLSFDWYTELLASDIANKIGTKQAEELFGDYWANYPTIVVDKPADFDFESLQQIRKQLAQLSGINPIPQGSNNWVISGQKSESGKPILANDPHLLLSNPSRWYMVHLVAPEINAAGFTFPGSPGIVIGFNQKISWGFTNVMTDDADFFIETIDPADSTKYRLNGRWQSMQQIKESIPVKGKDTKSVTIYLTEHGPVINKVHPRAKKRNQKIALRWIGQEISDEVNALYRLNRAENWQEFQQAIRQFKVPSQNVVYGDADGNIGYWCMGLIPIRSEPPQIYPTKSGNNWSGFIPFLQLPHAYNPESGFLATANNRVAPKDYPYFISRLWEPPSRIMRIQQLLTQDKLFSIEDFKTIQTDVYSHFAEYLVPKILPELKLLADQDETYRQMYQFLLGWDFYVRGENVAASIFHVFLQHFLQNTYEDELGEENYKDYIHFAALPLRMVRKTFDLNLSHWFDDVNTKDHSESALEIITKSWQESCTELTNRLGDEQIKWRWDKIHQVTFKHFLGDEPLLGKIFNVGPLPMSGSHTTINNGYYDFADPYNCIVGPSMRMIVDMGHPGQAEVINPPGQVGHPLSDHYRDLAEFWLNGLYVTLDTDTTAIKESNYHRLLLNTPNYSK